MNTRRGFLGQIAALGALAVGLRPQPKRPIIPMKGSGRFVSIPLPDPSENHLAHLRVHTSLLKEVYGRPLTEHLAQHESALWDKLGA